MINKYQNHQTARILLLLILFTILYFVNSTNIVIYPILYSVFLVVIIFVYSLRDVKSRIGILLLTSSIFFFLMSRTISRVLNGTSLEEFFTDTEVMQLFRLISLSLLSLLFSDVLLNSKRIDSKLTSTSLSKMQYRYLFISKVLFYFGSLAKLYTLILRISLFNSVGYVETYLEWGTIIAGVPYIVSKLADIYLVAYVIMLSFLPKWNQIKYETMIFLFLAIISLFTGQRFGFVVPVIFLAWYFFHFGYIGKTKKNQTQYLIRFLIFGYFMLIILNFIGRLRVDTTYSLLYYINPINSISEFGASSQVILRTFRIHSQISVYEGFRFFFAPIVNLLSNNYISQLIFQTPIFRAQSIDYALYTYNYGSFLTYTIDPNFYLSGGGFGSSYIAESYLFLGSFGVFAISFVYGFVLNIPRLLKKKNWVVLTFVFLMVYWLFYAPRDAALYFLTSGINLTVILTILAVYIGGQLIRNRGQQS